MLTPCIITAPCHPWLEEKLALHHQVQYEPAITYEELATRMAGVEGLVVTTRLKIDEALLQQAPDLRWIGRLGSGLELIDLEACARRGIRVESSPEGNRNAVAEHALGMLLSCLRFIPKSMQEIKSGQWLRNENRGTELAGKVVGIVGYGNTGSQFARLLEPFGVTVLANDKSKHGFANHYIREAALDQIQRYADVISFHLPLADDTRYLADKAFFEACAQRPVILNTSRGKVVQQEALVEALKQQWISGACLDVLENERLNTYTPQEQDALQWLLQQPNVVITPHIAGYSHEAYLQMGRVLYQKLFG